MKMVPDVPNNSGAYYFHESTITELPDGMVLWPDDLPTDVFFAHDGLVVLDIQEVDGVPTVVGYEVNREAWDALAARRASLLDGPESVDAARAAKLAGLSDACSAAITAGCDVTLSAVSGHISLTAEDQINLSTAMQAVEQGAAGYPYHLDGQLCAIFSATDIRTMAQAATAHKLYHTTYYNHLAAWVRRCETVAEIDAITYGAALPEDLAASMAAIMAAAGGEADAV